MKILCFGSLNLDHTYRLHHFLAPGETNHALSYHVGLGGKGFNQAAALARAGAKVSMGGCIGADGARFRTFLREIGVDETPLKTVDAPTGHAMIQVDDSGENCILVYPGANHALTEAQIEETLCRFQAGDLLLAQNETNLVGVLLKKAKEHGLITVLNPSPMTEELKSEVTFSDIDWLILNRAELMALTGTANAQEAMKQLREQNGGCRLVVTLGSEGVLFFDGESIIRQPAFPVQAVDTTGAGDTFTGYFLQTYYETGSPEKALERAAAAAALAVTRSGAADAIPEAETVNGFMYNIHLCQE